MTLFLISFLKLILYFIICASLALLLRIYVKLPNEVFRKTLHFILLGSAPVFLNVFDNWHHAALAPLVFAIMVYPILSLAENLKNYSQLLVERNSGEIKKSLIHVSGMFSLVIAISWGLIGVKYIALAVIFAWGLGDATAALVGKKYGKRRIEGKYIDGKKTLEGSFAMFLVSIIVIFIVLNINTKLSWYDNLIISFITALVNSLVELNTKHGFDTITCPISIILVMLPLLYLMG